MIDSAFNFQAVLGSLFTTWNPWSLSASFSFCKILIGSSLLIIRLQIEAIPPIMFVWSHFAKGYSKLVMMLLVWYERPIKVKKKIQNRFWGLLHFVASCIQQHIWKCYSSHHGCPNPSQYENVTLIGKNKQTKKILKFKQPVIQQPH